MISVLKVTCKVFFFIICIKGTEDKSGGELNLLRISGSSCLEQKLPLNTSPSKNMSFEFIFRKIANPLKLQFTQIYKNNLYIQWLKVICPLKKSSVFHVTGR